MQSSGGKVIPPGGRPRRPGAGMSAGMLQVTWLSVPRGPQLVDIRKPSAEPLPLAPSRSFPPPCQRSLQAPVQAQPLAQREPVREPSSGSGDRVMLLVDLDFLTGRCSSSVHGLCPIQSLEAEESLPSGSWCGISTLAPAVEAGQDRPQPGHAQKKTLSPHKLQTSVCPSHIW